MGDANHNQLKVILRVRPQQPDDKMMLPISSAVKSNINFFIQARANFNQIQYRFFSLNFMGFIPYFFYRFKIRHLGIEIEYLLIGDTS